METYLRNSIIILKLDGGGGGGGAAAAADVEEGTCPGSYAYLEK